MTQLLFIRRFLLFFVVLVIVAPLFLKYLLVGNEYLRTYTALVGACVLVSILILRMRFRYGISLFFALFLLWQICIEAFYYQLTETIVNVLLSQAAGIIIGLLLINIDKRVGLAVIISSLLLLIFSQILESQRLLPAFVNGSPFPMVNNGRYNGLGYVNDNGFLYGVLLLFALANRKVWYLSTMSVGLLFNKTGSAIASVVALIPAHFVSISTKDTLVLLTFSIFGLIFLMAFGSTLLESDRFYSFVFRFILWTVAIENYSVNLLQIIFGIGLSATRQLTLPLQEGTVHSNWLGIFFSYGLVGIVLNILLLLKLYQREGTFLVASYFLLHGITHEYYYSAPVIATFIALYSYSVPLSEK